MTGLIGCYNKSVILTYVGIAVALFGIFNVENLKCAIICLMIAGVCDLFDGKVARMCKRTEQEKEFGVQIDSLADVIASLVFPVVILFQIVNTTNANKIFAFIIAVLYILAGVTRLGWFNITTDGKTVYYQGLPVTSIAIILPLIYILFKSSNYFGYIAILTFMWVALFFVLDIKIKKLSGKWYAILAGLAVVFSVIIYLI